MSDPHTSESLGVIVHATKISAKIGKLTRASKISRRRLQRVLVHTMINQRRIL